MCFVKHSLYLTACCIALVSWHVLLMGQRRVWVSFGMQTESMNESMICMRVMQ